MSIAFTVTKYYTKFHTMDKPFRVEDVSGMKAFTDGWVEYVSEDQSMERLDVTKHEFVRITVNNMPFITFHIVAVNHFNSTGGTLEKQTYKLESTSPVSLRTYETICNDPTEHWGQHNEIGDCINKAISIVAGFMNGLKTGEINEGNYYDDDKG